MKLLFSWLKSSKYQLRTCHGYPMTWVLENTVGHRIELVTVTTIQTWALITATDHRHYTQETEGTTVRAKYFKGRNQQYPILRHTYLPLLIQNTPSGCLPAASMQQSTYWVPRREFWISAHNCFTLNSVISWKDKTQLNWFHRTVLHVPSYNNLFLLCTHYPFLEDFPHVTTIKAVYFRKGVQVKALLQLIK